MSKLWEINYLSDSHIHSAILFANQARKIEEDNKDKAPYYIVAGEWERSPHTSYIIGSIVFSVAFLEAFINEKYKLVEIELREGYAGSFLKIDWSTREAIRNKWNENDKRDTISKFDLLSAYIKNKKLYKGDCLFDNIRDISKLRNYLIHYKPDTIQYPSHENEIVEIHELGKKLKRKKFDINPLVHSQSPFFPKKCLSYGCAKWAITSVIDFADAFMCLIGREDYCNHLKREINYPDFVR